MRRRCPPRRLTLERLEIRANPAVLTVNTLSDDVANDNVLSLREAVTAVNAQSSAGLDAGAFAQITDSFGSNDTINFTGLSGLIALGGNELPLDRNVTVLGPGRDLLLIDGDFLSRILNVGVDVTANVSGLTFTNGRRANANGGAILNNGGLSLTDVAFNFNTVINTNNGGAIQNANTGTLTVTRGFFLENSAEQFGGAIRNTGTATIIDSTFTSNSSASDGGAISSTGPLTVIGLTFDQNHSAFSGGAISLSGNDASSLVNSTFSDNTAVDNGGAIIVNGTTAFTLTASNLTIAGNHANSADTQPSVVSGGIYVSGGLVTLTNSLVVGNYKGSGTTTPDDISTNINPTSSFNLIGNPTTAGGLTHGVNGNILGKDNGSGGRMLIPQSEVLAAALTNNGGPTQTRALVANSPAINAGSNTAATNAGLTTDQRGIPFARIANGTVDIGAYEFWNSHVSNAPPVNAIPATQTVLVSNAILFCAANGNAISVSDADNDPVSVNLRVNNGTLTIANNFGLNVNGDHSDNLTIFGALPAVQAVLETLFYEAPNSSGITDTLTITSSDGQTQDVDAFNISIVSSKANVAPTITLPTATQYYRVNSPFVFSQANNNLVQVGDVDSGYGTAQITLQVTQGKLSLASTSGLTFAFGNGTLQSTTIFSGRIDDLNAAMSTLTFTPDLSYVGTSVMYIFLNDLGNAGSGGHLSDFKEVSLLGLPLLVDNNGSDIDDGNYSPGNFTLREAVNLSNANPGLDTISFNTSLNNQTITLTSELPITDPVTITGLGADHLTISGNDTSRIFNVDDGNNANVLDVSISNLTMTRGFSGIGGAIINFENLTINLVEIANSNAGFGGGIHGGTGSNTTISFSTLAGNNATNGDGGAVSGLAADFTILNSTLSGNNATRFGGAVSVQHVNLLVVHSTIVKNRTGSTGGGINIFAGNAILQNSIVAGNQLSNGTPHEIQFTPGTLNGQNNLIGNASSAGNLSHGVNDNIVGVNGSGTIDINTILNTTLADNGGPTRTHALVPGSLAFSAGNNTIATNAGLTTDQRGTGFARIRGGTVDIGAVEQKVTPSGFTLSPNPAMPSSNQQLTIVMNLSGSPVPTGTVTLFVDGVPGVPASLFAGPVEITLNGLPVGLHTIFARYSGDANYAGVDSTLLNQQVFEPSDLNRSNAVDITDVLISVFYFNAYANQLPITVANLPAGPPFVDASGDGAFDIRDLLRVVFDYNQSLANPEGEAAPLPVLSPAPSPLSTTDAVFSEDLTWLWLELQPAKRRRM